MTTTTSRRAPAPWALALAGVILAGALMLAVTTIDLNPTTPAPVAPVTAPVFSDEHLERAERIRAAQRELAGLRDAVNGTPSIRDSMRYRMKLLTLVSSRHVPVEALDPAQ